MIAGTLELQMITNLARLSQDMAQAKAIVGNAASVMEGALSSLKKMAGTLAAGLSVRMFVGFVGGAIDAADHLNDLSKQTGIAVETLGGLGFAAKQSGGNLDSMASAVGKLNKAIAEAATGSAEKNEPFAKMGISVRDATGQIKAADKLMLEIADKFAGYADGPNKVAIAMRIMGKAGAEQIPLLNEGGAAILANVEYYKRYSGVTKDVAERSDQFNDQLEKLHLLSGALGTKIASELLDPLKKLADYMLEAKENSKAFENTAEAMKTVFSGLAAYASTYAFVINNIVRGMREAAELRELIKAGDGKGILELGIRSQRATTEGARAQTEFVASLFRAPTAADRDDADAGRFRMPSGKLPDAPGIADKGAVAKAAAELLKYENALRSLMDQLGKFQDMTVQEKTTRDLQIGSLKGLTKAHQENLIAVAKKIDIEKQADAVAKSSIASIEAQIKAQEALDAVVGGFRSTNVAQIEDLEQQTKLLQLEITMTSGVTATQAELLKQTAAFNIARDTAIVDQQLLNNYNKAAAEINADESVTISEKAKRTRELTAEYERQRAALGEGIINRESTQLALEQIKLQREEWKSLWNTVESTGRDVFVHVFSDGKTAFQGIGRAIKASVVDLLFQLTAKKWIIKMDASIAGSLGIGGTANASGGSDISSILGIGNSAANLAGGAGSGLYGALATSSIGQSLGLSSFVNSSVGLGVSEGSVALSGLGAGLGTALPYIGIALAAYSLLKKKKTPASFSGGRLTGSAGMSGFEGTLFGTSTSDPNNPLMNQWVNAESGHVSDLLQAPVKAAFDEMRKLAELLKLDTSKLAEVRATFDLTNVGQIGAEVLPAFEQNIGTLTDSIALGLMPNLADFAQANETLTQTFTRLASAAEEADQQVQAVNMEAVTAAQDVLREAYKAQADDLTQSISKWADAAQTLRDYGASLAGGSGGLSYSAAAARFAITAAQARSGSVDAMGNLQSASEAFRMASLAHSGTSSDYTRDVLKIRSAVGDSADLADRNRSLVQQQLDSLTALVEGQITVNERLVTVEEAIARLASANADMARDTKRAADTLEGAANGQFEFSTVAA